MTDIVIRRADEADLPQIVAMLTDAPLGDAREAPPPPLLPSYIAAFVLIDSNPAQILVVAEADGRILGTLQMNFVIGIARQGMRRAIIESVRVAADGRRQGLGGQIVQWAIEEARRRGCGIVQLVSNESHITARRFYERLGFKHTQTAMKLEVEL